MVRATTLFAVVALAASSALAAPQTAKRFVEHSVHEERLSLPPHWSRSESSPLNRRDGGALKRDVVLPVRINLAQNNVDRAHDILMDISDPESPRYSEHLSPLEVAELVCALFPSRNVSLVPQSFVNIYTFCSI